MKKISMLSIALMLSLAACNKDQKPVDSAANQEPVQKQEAAPVLSPVEQVTKTLKTRFPAMDLQEVKSVGGQGIQEMFVIKAAQFEDRMAYTNLNVDFVVVGGDLYTPTATGEMVNKTTELNSSQQDEKNKKIFGLIKELPFGQALKYQYGNGERVLVSFEDPDCPQCSLFTKQLMVDGILANTMVYVMPMPLEATHPNAVYRAKYLMCTEKPENSWSEWMVSSPEQRADWDSFAKKHPSQEGCERAKIVDQVVDITAELDFKATPTLLFENGMIFAGRPDNIQVLDQSFAVVKQTLDAVKQNNNGQELPVLVPPLQPFRKFTDEELKQAQAEIDAARKKIEAQSKK